MLIFSVTTRGDPRTNQRYCTLLSTVCCFHWETSSGRCPGSNFIRFSNHLSWLLFMQRSQLASELKLRWAELSRVGAPILKTNKFNFSEFKVTVRWSQRQRRRKSLYCFSQTSLQYPTVEFCCTTCGGSTPAPVTRPLQLIQNTAVWYSISQGFTHCLWSVHNTEAPCCSSRSVQDYNAVNLDVIFPAYDRTLQHPVNSSDSVQLVTLRTQWSSTLVKVFSTEEARFKAVLRGLPCFHVPTSTILLCQSIY